MHHWWRAYGGWTFELVDYYALNFTAMIDIPQMQQVSASEKYFTRNQIGT